MSESEKSIQAVHPVYRILDPAFYQDPWEGYAWLRKNKPIYYDDAAELWAVTRYEDIRQCAMDQETFSSFNSRPSEEPQSSMINQDEPEHMQRRDLIRRRFTPQSIRRYDDYIRLAISWLIDQIIEKGECDFVRDIATPVPMLMIGDLMGLPPSDYEQLLEWSDLFATGADTQSTPEFIQTVRDAIEEYHNYIFTHLEDRRGNPSDDLLSDIVHGKVGGEPLTTKDLLAESMLILVGGDETTRHVISGGMKALLEHPDQMAWVQEDLDERLPAAIEEMLRWVTPVKNMMRTATCDTELGGQKLSKGDRVLLLYESGNRDETVFENPDEFRVDRNPNHHLAFGGYGRHFCMGGNLARREIMTVFEEVFRRMKNIEIVEGADIPYRLGNFVLGIEALPIRFTPGEKENKVADVEDLQKLGRVAR